VYLSAFPQKVSKFAYGLEEQAWEN